MKNWVFVLVFSLGELGAEGCKTLQDMLQKKILKGYSGMTALGASF